MDPRDYLFAVHRFSVKNDKGEAVDFSAVDGVDIYILIADRFEKLGISAVEKNSYTEVVRAFRDDKNRMVTGYLEGGLHGEEKPIVNVDFASNQTSKTQGKIGKGQSAPDSYFYSLFVPVKGSVGYFMLQQRGVRSNSTFFSEVIKQLIKPMNLQMGTTRLSPADLARLLKEAELDKMTFIEYGASSWALKELEAHGDLSEIGKVTLIVEPKSNGTLNSFKQLAKKLRKKSDEGYMGTESLEFDPGKSKFTFKMGGRQYMATADTGAAGRPAYVETFDVSVDEVELHKKLVSYSKGVFEGILALPEDK